VGDEAFRVAYAGGDEMAVAARKGPVLVLVYGGFGGADNGGPQIVFDRLTPIAAGRLDAAATAVSGIAPAPTTTVASSAANSIETHGAVDGVWVVREADVAGAAECGTLGHVDIPITSTDGHLIGHLEIGVKGDFKAVLLGSGKLTGSLVGSGRFDLSFSDDSEHPTATLEIDTTLTGTGGSVDTTVKGRLSFTCP
jgi:hypothetical protein